METRHSKGAEGVMLSSRNSWDRTARGGWSPPHSGTGGEAATEGCEGCLSRVVRTLLMLFGLVFLCLALFRATPSQPAFVLYLALAVIFLVPFIEWQCGRYPIAPYLGEWAGMMTYFALFAPALLAVSMVIEELRFPEERGDDVRGLLAVGALMLCLWLLARRSLSMRDRRRARFAQGLMPKHAPKVAPAKPAVSATSKPLLSGEALAELVGDMRGRIEAGLAQEAGSGGGQRQARAERLPESLYRDIASAVARLLSAVQSLRSNAFATSGLGVAYPRMPLQDMGLASDTRVALASLCDVMYCHRQLGYDVKDSGRAENVGLMLFVVKLLVPATSDTPGQEALAAIFGNEGADTLGRLLDAVQSYVPTNVCPLLTVIKGRTYDDVLALRYLTLLYELSTALAKVDGKTSEKESAFIGSLQQSLLIYGSKVAGRPGGAKAHIPPSPRQAAGTAPAPVRRKAGTAKAEQELSELIGLSSVKEEVTKLANFARIQQMRQAKGMGTTPISYHCVFTGNPGTGKTTVARILASIYQGLGLLQKGHLIETDRSGLVAEYVGQTASKTNKIIDSALGGVLFIDEAYSLAQGGNGDYGREAISTLLKRMEDERDRLVVILAGYGNEMKQFIDSNPGLQSRFNRYIHFPDYSSAELMAIVRLDLHKLDYELAPEAEASLVALFEHATAHKDKNFGNGRLARNIVEKMLENQAMRLASQQEVTDSDLRTVKASDVPPISSLSNPLLASGSPIKPSDGEARPKIGFT